MTTAGATAATPGHSLPPSLTLPTLSKQPPDSELIRMRSVVQVHLGPPRKSHIRPKVGRSGMALTRYAGLPCPLCARSLPSGAAGSDLDDGLQLLPGKLAIAARGSVISLPSSNISEQPPSCLTR